jgi:hypothetical protein
MCPTRAACCCASCTQLRSAPLGEGSCCCGMLCLLSLACVFAQTTAAVQQWPPAMPHRR